MNCSFERHAHPDCHCFLTEVLFGMVVCLWVVVVLTLQCWLVERDKTDRCGLLFRMWQTPICLYVSLGWDRHAAISHCFSASSRPMGQPTTNGAYLIHIDYKVKLTRLVNHMIILSV